MLADFELAEVIWDVAEPGLSLDGPGHAVRGV
jgi:hypothetical protein